LAIARDYTDFNLNLLDRINKELEANFDLDSSNINQSMRAEGIAKVIWLVLKAQQVYILQLDKTFFLMKGKILMEISRKYNDTILNSILSKTDFVIKDKITDKGLLIIF
jgi:uncharacterized SAM-dependent methyltransferase